ncbi:hypothetical protein I552_2933 [Mycobacterium xenopi 3993]|nr:hypothetical protein I552_2933 [Mycobacterium xenopi 3993]
MSPSPRPADLHAKTAVRLGNSTPDDPAPVSAAEFPRRRCRARRRSRRPPMAKFFDSIAGSV